MLTPEGIKTTTKEIMNQHEDPKIIKTHQKKNKSMVRKSIPLKKGNIIKGKWAESEDRKLKEIVELYGIKKWGLIAKKLGGRKGKQCRERWYNHLCPDIKKDAWTEEEDKILIKAHMVVGTKWTEISKQLPGRSANTIKNHWNTTKRRRQKQIDEKANQQDHIILENYIRNVTINKDDISKVIKTDDKTANTKDDGNCKDMFYKEVNFNVDAKTHTAEALVDAYVPMPEMFAWENYTTELFEPMDYTQMLMDWWE